ncbi:hypothetical protein ACFQDG_16925 [Natronoarchaeum mannanilyticum]|uniref:Uncharacterized protein n=1 Tax=Natronoarchaeum mannanilyticum TaxID=926360 RepID=A0AAV3T657_9EURY
MTTTRTPSFARARRIALTAWCAVLAYTGTALAHTGHAGESAESGGAASPLPMAAFVVGVIVVATSVYLDSVGDVPRKAADAGVFVGIAVAAVGATAFFWGHGI